jgi:orotidine-5'-phosphate decarboxylase
LIGLRFKREILEKSEENNSKLILALDVPGERVLKLLDEASGYLAAVKIGYPVVLEAGLEIISKIKRASGLPIIADFKIADIPHTNQLIARCAYDAGSDAVIAHAFVGRDSLEAIIKVAEEKGDKGVIVVPNMSHPGASMFIGSVSERMAKLAVDVGATGVIGPATKPGEITVLRSWVGGELLILSPGVGAQEAQPGDAIKSDADFEIVGRAICTAESPVKMARAIRDQINESMEA